MTNLIERVKAALNNATPGPWCVEDETLIWTQINDPDDAEHDIGYPVAESRRVKISVGNKLWPEGQPEANATLIALAPDLAREYLRLKKVEEAAKELELVATAMSNRLSLYSGGSDDSLVNDAEQALAACRAAVEGKK